MTCNVETSGSTTTRTTYTPPEAIRREGVLIAGGFTALKFSFTKDSFTLFAGPPRDVAGRETPGTDEESRDQEDWTTGGFPGRIWFEYGREGEEPARLVLIPGTGLL